MFYGGRLQVLQSKDATRERAVLLGTCPDRKGLVFELAQYIYERGGNIVDSDQHTDHEAGIFATRLEWELYGFNVPKDRLKSEINEVLSRLGMSGQLCFTSQKTKIAVFGSHQDHCILDLLGRENRPDFNGKIKVIISNHRSLEELAKKFSVPFFYCPIKTDGSHESEQLRILKEYDIDLVVLAKYMQILSPQFLNLAPIAINIHHSFLPAFPGGQPYHRAFARGVKVIGATAHFVTEHLDEGPIIEQCVCRVSHRDTVQDLIRKGKDLEMVALSQALYFFLEHRVLVYGNKTIVFD